MPASKPCPVAGCPRYRPCPEHKRGTTTERGYGTEHTRRRKAEQLRMDRDGFLTCTRCGGLITTGQAWDLGHTDDRQGWTGPEHATCNRSEAGRKSSRRAGNI